MAESMLGLWIDSNGVHTTTSSTPATFVGIVTELLRVPSNYIEASQPREADFAERVNVVEDIDC